MSAYLKPSVLSPISSIISSVFRFLNRCLSLKYCDKYSFLSFKSGILSSSTLSKTSGLKNFLSIAHFSSAVAKSRAPLSPQFSTERRKFFLSRSQFAPVVKNLSKPLINIIVFFPLFLYSVSMSLSIGFNS